MSALFLPSVEGAKTRARRLRAKLAHKGQDISHSTALELVAAQYGFKDWNAMAAACRLQGASLPSLAPGYRLKGQFRGQDFQGMVKSATALGNELQRLTILFDTPIDVVSFDRFSAYRRYVTHIVDADGVTVEKSANGTPHLRITQWSVP